VDLWSSGRGRVAATGGGRPAGRRPRAMVKGRQARIRPQRPVYTITAGAPAPRVVAPPAAAAPRLVAPRVKAPRPAVRASASAAWATQEAVPHVDPAWAEKLRTAWMTYCAATPAAQRCVPGFLKPVLQANLLYMRKMTGQPITSTNSVRSGWGAGSPGGWGAGSPGVPAQKARSSRGPVAAVAAPEPAVWPDSGPMPEAVRILVPKYGLVAGACLRIIGRTKLAWRAAEYGKTVPFDQEGTGWERITAAEVGDAPLVTHEADAPPDVEVEEWEEEEAEEQTAAGKAATATAHMPEPELPWVIVEHPDEPGQFYYFNEETGDAVWELPSEEDTKRMPEGP